MGMQTEGSGEGSNATAEGTVTDPGTTAAPAAEGGENTAGTDHVEPAAAAAPAESEPGEGDPAEADPENPPVEAFKPQAKFKVMDQEHDIDPMFLEAIKTPEQEAKFRELYEKAYGLDIVKPKYQEARKENSELKQTVQGYSGTVDRLRTAYQRGDLDSFFSMMKVSEEKVLQWVADKVKYNQLPPEQKEIWDRHRQSQKSAWENEDSKTQVEAGYGEHLATVTGEMLELALERDEVQRFAAAFDEKMGKPHSFRNAVIDVGEAAWERGTNLTPLQAVKQVMEHYGKFIQAGQAPAPQGGQQPQSGGQSKPAATAPKKEPPVIPNISGRTTSPTAPKVKNLDDLKKLAANFQD